MAVERIEQPAPNLPPHNLEAEQSVLGAMLVNPNAIAVAAESVAVDDFYRDAHRLVYGAILTLYDRGEEVDVITVSAELERNGRLDKAGGREFVHSLAEFVPTAANAGHYARIVHEQSVLRGIIRAGSEIFELGSRHPGTVPELLDRCEQIVFAIQQQRGGGDFHLLKDVLGSTFEKLEAMQQKESVSGVASGFEPIDRLTGGFQPSNLIVLAARPGVGKTSLALNIAQNVAMGGKSPVAIFSLEMSAQELGERLMCSTARVSSHKVRTGTLSGDDYGKLIQAVGELEKAEIFIDESAGLNMFELRAKARRLKSRNDLKLIIVDYLQLMTGDGRAENRQQEVAAISRSLKQLGRELHLPIIAVSQLNRAPEVRADREPQLADLRESGAIEQDADLVVFLYEDPRKEQGPQSKGVINVRIAKNRNGPTDTVRLGWVKEYTKFRVLPRSDTYDYDETEV